MRRRLVTQSGFTLIELLIAALLLGLLCAIAVPAFFAQRDKARDAEAKVQVRTAQTAIETYATDRNGSYAGATTSALQQIDPTLAGLSSSELAVQPMGASGKYRITVLAATGNAFTIRREADDTWSYACTTPGRAGCPAGGLWAN